MKLKRTDDLVLERTFLANERTFLAYLLTFIVFLSSGVAIIKFPMLSKIQIIGYTHSNFSDIIDYGNCLYL